MVEDVHGTEVEDAHDDGHESIEEAPEKHQDGHDSIVLEEGDEKQPDGTESVVEEADEDRHESTEDTAEAIDKPGVPKPKGMKGQCPLFCSPGKEYANIYKHMQQKHKTTYTKATGTMKRRALESETESESENEASAECSDYVPEEETEKLRSSPDPPLTPELLRKKRTRKLVPICRGKSPKYALHSKIAHHNLSQAISLELLSGLESYLKEVSGSNRMALRV